mgnify:CR=1 FL=1
MTDLDLLTSKIRAKLINRRGFIPLNTLTQEQITIANIDPGYCRDFIRNCGLSTELTEYLSLNEMNEILIKRGYHALYAYCSTFIKEEEFKSPSHIHGVEHTRRVLYLVFCLIHCLNIEADDAIILIIAALYHDIGRTNDGVDPKHGVKSYTRAEKRALLKSFSDQDKELIRFIIQNHSIDDNEVKDQSDLFHLDDRDRGIRLLWIFKDADGLDRVRLGDLKVQKLRHPESRALLLVAWQLLQQSG